MGVPSNKDYLACVMADPRFAAGETTTSFLKDLNFSPHGIEVIDPGMNTTVQVSCAVLCCAVLRCAVLCCAVLCCAVLCECSQHVNHQCSQQLALDFEPVSSHYSIS